ncbi:hypothetical protein [Halpernia frigidisoli]|uniref:Uncharacterized protein n=1 Tax=Halpernia frigidisoli TaxID=1125876 RepID=A0A1I3FSR4_9FLAO|nr:hypothetical protein [Halpernia frigidisoli]SFI13961.1 hypothetical protein SAMN05443292_1585 [Halpernia frigidisoli]
MSFDSAWTYEKLWLKAKVYISKALSEDRESEMFPFFSAIALEFIARATLAKVHPVLLADPREGENILYVFGFQKKPLYIPISVPTKTVLERCEVIVPNFTENEKTFCKEITIKRNEELHSGNLGFDNFPTKIWLSKYYKTLKILLEFQEKTLLDFLGSDEADAAEEMIAEREANLEKTIKDRISRHKKSFKALSIEIQTEKISNSERDKWFGSRVYRKDEICPSCGNNGILTGKLISISEGKASDSDITQNLNILPTYFICLCCDLQLTNHQELDSIELGGQYKIEEIFDPREYFEIENIEPDFDYGND